MVRKIEAQLLLDSNTSNEETVVHVNTDDDQSYLTDEEIALDNFIKESKQSGTEATIIVKKIVDTGNPNSSLQHCDTFPVDKYDFYKLHDVIKVRWGGGDYRMLCFAKNINGQKKLIQNKLITIAAEITQDKNTGNDRIIQQLLDDNRRISEKLASLSSGSGSGTLMSQVNEMAQIMNALRPPPVPERDTLGEMVKMMLAFKEIGPMLGLNMGGAQEDSGNSEMWKALGAAVPALVNGAVHITPTGANHVNNPINKPVNKRAGPVKPRADNPADIPITEETKKMNEEKMIESYLKHLEEYCDKKEPREIAEYIEDKAPNIEELMSVIIRPDFMTIYAVGFWSELTRRAWLSDVREWLLGFANEPSIFSDVLDAEDSEEISNGSLNGDDNVH